MAQTPTLESLLEQSASHHRHGICPRQILGVRMGLLAGALLNVAIPSEDKRLLAVVESAGCFVDGITVATGCRIGGRTLLMEDHGKIAATFVDLDTDHAIRIVPAPDSRDRAMHLAPSAPNRRAAQLSAYRTMPADDLFRWRDVRLVKPLDRWQSTPEKPTACDGCGEEVLNGRLLVSEGRNLCRACAGDGSYYQ